MTTRLHIGIVGNEAAKFTPETEAKAKALIMDLLFLAQADEVTLVSGRCHLGGIDVWAEEIADRLAFPKEIYPPRVHNWSQGYKPRNIKIAQASDIVHNIVVAEYPPDYVGMHFSTCYHCKSSGHVKSGGCWTAKCAQRFGKPAEWHVV